MFGRMIFGLKKYAVCYTTMLMLSLCMMISACTKENVETLQAGKKPLCNSNREISYQNDVVPILQAYCGSQSGCHSNGAASGGVKLEDYQGIREVAASGLLRKAIFHESGVSPMPQNSNKLDDCTLTILDKWLASGYPNN